MVEGAPRPVHGIRRKAVLATLALHCGEIVSTGRLVDVVWGRAAPSTAINTLQSHVSHLRGVLGCKSAILARPPGYLLDLGTDDTDVRLAERLLRQATKTAEPGHSIEHLTTALGLWRGDPLADVDGSAWLEEQAERLDLLCGQIKRALTEARLAAGEHAQLIGELEQMAADYPLDEQICGQLMLALYRSGRQADALAAFHRMRRTLDVELGLDPGQPLRDLETAILRQDPVLDVAPAAVIAAPVAPMAMIPAAAPVPAQLPPAVPAFAGRATELASLDAILPGQGGPAQPATVVISAVSGTAGVGKTALAVHWAHRVSPQFPDGQLYVNLRGFAPGCPPLDPGEVVRGFLEALGVPVARIPDGLAAQAALYRSLLAGKRVLVVLDNAHDVEQVRPLLPGSPGCLAIVTSRNQLTGLVAAEGAAPLNLDLLTVAGARDLLARRLGPGRVAAEPESVTEIIERCARLPLALTIAAARAATNPSFPMAIFAAELRDATRALDPFDGGDLATDVRAVFSWSYRALSAPAARLFRLLGLHHGPEVTTDAAASLAAVEQQRARLLLAELSRAHLLAERSPGRYVFHDLLRAYAAEQAHAQDSQQARDAAVDRVLGHYLHTACRGTAALRAVLNPITLDPPAPTVVVGDLARPDVAVAWFTAEHDTLMAAVSLAADARRGTRAWQLAWSMTTFLTRLGHWNDQATVWSVALAAARRDGDITGEARSLCGLASGYARAGRLGEAAPVFDDALRLFEIIGDQASQAMIHNSLTVMAERQMRPAEMLRHAQRALELYQAAGHRAGQAWILNNIGYSYALLGSYEQALTYCQRALLGIRVLGERCWEAATWHSLGYIHHHLGDFPQALSCYQNSLALCRELADRYNEADTLDHIGNVHRGAGDMTAARQAWLQALRIFEELDHPTAGQVRAKLRPRREAWRSSTLTHPHPRLPQGRTAAKVAAC
jgi:DNA-binding SARP family transcriptional activator/tetratricopeptide (TPR) repeat protein